jgi:hypothetical protein
MKFIPDIGWEETGAYVKRIWGVYEFEAEYHIDNYNYQNNNICVDFLNTS